MKIFDHMNIQYDNLNQPQNTICFSNSEYVSNLWLLLNECTHAKYINFAAYKNLR